MRRLVACVASVVLCMPFWVVAQAQNTETSDVIVVEEIVVTASKREQNLQDVPLTITAITAEQISEFDLTTIQDFVDLVPNALVDSGTFGINDTIVIRGVGLPLDFIEQGTGVYQNGYYIGGARTVFSDFMDLQRVEVLRGPQGGLYGRNAVGGTVNFIHNGPKMDEFEGSVELQYGEYDRTEARGILNVPLAEGRLALRLNSWIVDQQEGEYYNITLQEWQDRKEISGFRASALWQVSEVIDVTVWADFTSLEGPENRGAAEEIGGESKNALRRDTPSNANKDWRLQGLTVNWETDLGTVSSLTSVREYKLDSFADQDGYDDKNFAFQTISRDEDVDSLFQELRLVSPADRAVQYIVGFNYIKEDLNLYRPVHHMDPTGALLRISATQAEVNAESFSYFAEITWSVMENLDVILSGRQTNDEKLFDFERSNTGSPSILLDRDDDWSNQSIGAGVAWRVNDRVNLYFRANEGFRPGGYNTGFSFGVDPALAAQVIPYGEETSLNMELGAKTSWFQDRFILNIALYRLDQTDVLGGVFDFGSFNFFFQNLGESETDGIEIDFTARPVENLTFSGSLGYIDGKILEVNAVPGAFVTISEGGPIPGGNSTTASLMASYRFPFSSSMDVLLSALWKYQDNRDPYSPGAVEGGELFDYSIVDLHAGVEADMWSLTGFIRNVTDDDYVISQAFFNPGGQFFRPVTNRANGENWGIRLKVAF